MNNLHPFRIPTPLLITPPQKRTSSIVEKFPTNTERIKMKTTQKQPAQKVRFNAPNIASATTLKRTKEVSLKAPVKDNGKSQGYRQKMSPAILAVGSQPRRSQSLRVLLCTLLEQSSVRVKYRLPYADRLYKVHSSAVSRASKRSD